VRASPAVTGEIDEMSSEGMIFLSLPPVDYSVDFGVPTGGSIYPARGCLLAGQRILGVPPPRTNRAGHLPDEEECSGKELLWQGPGVLEALGRGRSFS
jgi:hypothetical protein